MSQVTVTTITWSVTTVCVGVTTATLTVVIASTSVGLPGVLDRDNECHHHH